MKINKTVFNQTMQSFKESVKKQLKHWSNSGAIPESLPHPALIKLAIIEAAQHIPMSREMKDEYKNLTHF